jgi:hypothetical protein
MTEIASLVNVTMNEIIVFQILTCFASFCVQERPPPIPFVVKNMDKVNGPDADKSEALWIKLQFLMDPDNLA